MLALSIQALRTIFLAPCKGWRAACGAGLRRAGGALASLLLLLAPTSAWALSGQCQAINNNQIALGAGHNAPGTLRGIYSIGNQSFAGEQLSSSNYSDFNQALAPGEVITYSWTRYSGTGYVHVILQEQSGFTLRSGSVENRTTSSGSGTITVGAANDVFNIAVTNYTVDAANGATNAAEAGRNNTSVAFTISCAEPAPALSSFTYGSIVGYNDGGDLTTNISVAVGGNATNSPTGYTVSNASGGTYAASASTTGGGTVTINSSGQATYTPRAGYRGNDTFYARASNNAGSSSPATVTMTIGDPTITSSVSGTGARPGFVLSGYTLAPTGGRATYSCNPTPASGALPSGVSIGTNCALSGTPSAAGNYTFGVTITDSSVTGANGGTASPFQASNVLHSWTITAPTPTVTSVSPTAGPTIGGTTVVITGTNFIGTTGAAGVRFGATNATSYTVNSDTQITATAPARPAGTYDITVTNSGNTSATSAADQFTYVAAPTVTSISPTAGPTSGGTTVTITGTNLSGATAVTFGGTAASGFTVITGTSITATAPAGSVGTVDIRVTTVGGTSATSAADQFTYVVAPTVTSISPTAGPTGGGTTVIITGTGFSAANPTGAVKFGATNATYTINSDTQITATSPANSAGTYDVTVTTVGGTSATSAADQFTYVPAPTITSVSSNSGPETGGTPVTITGTNFARATAVTFGGTAAMGFTVVSGTSIIATAPAGSGIIDIRVTTAGGTSAISVGDRFTYIPPPTVTSLSQTAGPVAGGGTIIINGTNFTGATAVMFGATPATGVTVYNAFQIGVSLPAGSVGTVNVTVTTPGGTSATGSANAFTYVAAPVVTGITPTQGPAGGGTVVTITGSNFLNATGVVFGGNSALSFSVDNDSQITATSRPGGGVVDVRVVTAGGTSATSSADQFTFVSPPSISGVSPPPIAYGAVNATFSIASRTSNNPTSFAVGSATTGFGGSVSIDNAGLITYSAPAGHRGTDSFTVNATNLGGTSSWVTVLVEVGNPVLNSTLTGSGTHGTALSGVQIVTTGGKAPYSCAVTAGPAGTQINSNCTISGTPTASGNFSFTASVTDSSTSGTHSPAAFTQTTGSLSLSVAAPTVSLSPASGALPGATGGSSYSQTFTAGGGATTPFSYSHTAGALPPGLTLTGATLSGTPTAAGNFNFSITARDATTAGNGGPYSVTESYSINVSQGFQSISFAAGASSTRQQSPTPVTLTATATSGLTVTLTSATTSVCTVLGDSVTLLRIGTCTINADQAGNGAFAAAATATHTITVVPASLTITPGTPTGLKVGVPYSHAHTAAGGVAPYSYSLGAGAFVPNTNVNTTTGEVSGTPTVAGSFSYILRVTDSQPLHADTPVTTVTIAKGDHMVSFTSVPPAATVGGTPYTVTASATSNLGVTFMRDPSSTGCTLSGNMVQFISTGTCVINAVQAGDSNWNPATPAQQSIAVGPAGSVTASLAFAPNAVGVGDTGTLTITFNNPNVSTTPDVAPLLSSSALLVRTGSVAGSCGVTGSDAGANFQFNPFQIPSGSCTVTLDYTGTIPGASSGMVLGAFTPSGYPTTAAANGNAFEVLPTVTAVSPNSGPVSQVVTISGTGFSTTPGNNTVAFGATAGTVTAASSTSLTVTAPPVGSGPVSVTVKVNGRTSTTPASYTFIDPPIAANRPGVAVAYDSPGTAIDLAPSLSGGPRTSIAIGTAPAHGTASISSDVVTYTPTAGYYGPDSFTYTATGAGGTSGVATVDITVATPTAPVTSDRGGIAVPYNGTGTAIDLTGAISGVYSSVAIGVPTNGTATIAGNIVTYTPASGHYGLASFTFTATGPGGTSNVSTVEVTVATPPAPVAADRNGVAVPYASTGTAIDLSGSVTGVHASLALGTAPAHGTVTFAGDIATYVPSATHYGPDSFTYTATGPGGTSAPATVNLSVAAPPAPVVADRAGVAVPYASAGTAIDLSGSIAGVHSSIAVGTMPAHGTVTVAGNVVTYTPSATYFGADSFTYTATGPGGTSAPATVSLSVAVPPAPVAANKAGVAVPYASTGTAIDLTASVTGVHSSIAIGTAPAHGTVTVAGNVVTYTPSAAYFGADSFTYTATGPGGTSAPATVSLTVATPSAPVAADKTGVAVDYNGTGTAIDLSASVTGVRTAIAIGTAPAHGTATVAGEVVTYVPTAGYFGADSFTYTATGPGGTSAPATVSLSVATPPAPVVADKAGVAVDHNSSGTAIDLSASVTGVRTSIAIGTAPAHGTATVAGEVVTYVPSAGYFGADSFTYTATGPGGTSAPATVTLSVATPPAPVVADKAGVDVAYNSSGTAIDLTASVSGVVTSLAIGTQPAHGTVTLAGNVATYTPAANYHGADSFTVTATGPGGTSAPATIGLVVAAPPPPVSLPGNGTVSNSASTSGGSSVDIDLSALVTGDYTSIEISTPPAHGTVTLTGIGVAGPGGGTGLRAMAVPRITATYAPQRGFVGTDSFQFVAVGPGGRSAAATVTIAVAGTVPTATPKTAQTGDGQTVSVELTTGATEGPFTGASIVTVAPANVATTAIVEGGTAGNRTYRLDVTPNARYSGQVVVSYRLSNQYGASAPSTVTVTVAARPDPSADATVRGISDAQAETARRFARTQIDNFMRRNEQLHGSGGSAKASMGFRINSRDAQYGSMRRFLTPEETAIGLTDRMYNRADMGGTGGAGFGIGGHRPGGIGTPAAGGAMGGAPLNAQDDGEGDDGIRRIGQAAVWSAGGVDISTLDATTDRTKIRATTSGLSAGMDVKLAEGLTIGLGGGYGNENSRIGKGEGHVRAKNSIVAGYASYSPGDTVFVDGMLGYGTLSYRLRRTVTGQNLLATGTRDGDMLFGALSTGIDRSGEVIRWSAYARGEYMQANLDAYTETGAGRYNLRFDERTVRSLSSVLGGRFEIFEKTSFGSLSPRVRAEWRHEFGSADTQWLDYADIPGNAFHRIDTNGWKRDQIEFSLGNTAELPKNWSLDTELGLSIAQGARTATLKIGLTKEF